MKTLTLTSNEVKALLLLLCEESDIVEDCFEPFNVYPNEIINKLKQC